MSFPSVGLPDSFFVVFFTADCSVFVAFIAAQYVASLSLSVCLSLSACMHTSSDTLTLADLLSMAMPYVVCLLQSLERRALLLRTLCE